MLSVQMTESPVTHMNALYPICHFKVFFMILTSLIFFFLSRTGVSLGFTYGNFKNTTTFLIVFYQLIFRCLMNTTLLCEIEFNIKYN